MLNFTTGDMFEQPADARVNTVNCVGVMGKGIALEFKLRYPRMAREYRAACNRREIRPGDIWEWRADESFLIFNMATKNHWQDPSRYEWIAAGLLNLRQGIITSGALAITMPAPGCGLGGLDWRKVRPLVEMYLGDLPQRITCYEPI